MALCGAKNRSGQPCKRHAAVGSKRCKLHGGNNKPAKKGNKYAAKPGGLYSAYLTPEETKIAAALTLGSVDEEIRLTRIRLMRALRLEEERADTAELESEVERDGAENVTAHHERHLKVRDYAGLIDRLTARIAMLEKTRAELNKDAPPTDVPVTKIEIEVVSARKDSPVSDDGAAG
ncbi:MAG TPA: HGGxSTG domain-containing protein [Terriglobales bacterium]